MSKGWRYQTLEEWNEKRDWLLTRPDDDSDTGAEEAMRDVLLEIAKMAFMDGFDHQGRFRSRASGDSAALSEAAPASAQGSSSSSSSPDAPPLEGFDRGLRSAIEKTWRPSPRVAKRIHGFVRNSTEMGYLWPEGILPPSCRPESSSASG